MKQWVTLTFGSDFRSSFAETKDSAERKLIQKVKSFFLSGLRPNFLLSGKLRLPLSGKFGLSES